MSCSSYICETVIAGPVIEKRKYFAPRCPGMKIARSANTKKTSDEQWVVNEKRSIRNLYYTILENFCEEDIRLDLTYREPQPTPEKAKNHLDNFIRRIRYAYKKLGHSLKWIATTECEGHRVHHHLLINNVGIGRKELNQFWDHAKFNYKSFRFYDGQAEDAERLAKYLVKETRETFTKSNAVQKQRFRSSRNLRKPTIKKEVIHSKHWTETPKPIKGYYIQKPIRCGYTAFGYPYQFYRMIREDEDGETNKKKRRNVSSA